VHDSDKPEKQDPYLGLTKRYPHCDAYVLHAPGTCEYCDMAEFAALHKYRKEHRVNYTGERDVTKLLCPAEARRGKMTIDKWHGNRAKLSDPKGG
jgi:hypothetical protein